MSLFEEIVSSGSRLTGLSPSVLLYSVGALLITLVYLRFVLFSKRKSQKPAAMASPPPPPFTLGDVTAEELALYDGEDESKPLLMAIKGVIYDVSRAKEFYGPGGPYELFAGKDASRALAKMSFEDEDILNPNIDDLSYSEMETLNDWEMRFDSKYIRVGKLIKTSEKNEKDVKPTLTGENEKEKAIGDNNVTAETK